LWGVLGLQWSVSISGPSKEGTVVKRRQGHGWPSLIDAGGKQRLACVVQFNRRATVVQIAQEGADRGARIHSAS